MRHSTKFFAFLFMVFPFLISCVFTNQRTIYGDHQLINQLIDIDNYDKVILNIPADVFYQQFSDSAPYLQIHTDKNVFDALDVRVENDQLIIETKKDSIIQPSMLTIYMSSHNLSRVTVNGSGKIRLKGEVNAKDFRLDIVGSGNVQTDSLICNTFAARITGSGETQLKGASNHGSFSIIGSGNIHAFDYFVQDLNCKITGSGNIEALVTKQLDVNVIGSGNLSYRGTPQSINNKIAGSGKVRSVQ